MLRAGLDARRRSSSPWPAPATPARPFHLDGVREILAGAGLTEADLQNTPDLPVDARRARRLDRAPGRTARPWPRTARASTPACSPPAGCTAGTSRPTATPTTRCSALMRRDPRRARRRAGRRDRGRRLRRARHGRLARRPGPGVRPDRHRLRPAPPRREVAAAMRAHPEFVGGTRRDVTALIRGTAGPDRQGRRRRRVRRRAGRRSRRRPQGRRRRRSGPARSSWPPCCAGWAWSPMALRRASRTPRSSATASRSARSSPSASGSEPRVRAVLQRVSARRGHRRRRGRRRADPARPARPRRRHPRRRARRRSATIARKIADLRILRRRAVGARRRGPGARRQPVHPLRRHPQGPPPVVERRRARRRSPSRSSTQVVAALRARGRRGATGRFGAHMQVELVNDGPVTILARRLTPTLVPMSSLAQLQSGSSSACRSRRSASRCYALVDCRPTPLRRLRRGRQAHQAVLAARHRGGRAARFVALGGFPACSRSSPSSRQGSTSPTSGRRSTRSWAAAQGNQGPYGPW